MSWIWRNVDFNDVRPWSTVYYSAVVALVSYGYLFSLFSLTYFTSRDIYTTLYRGDYSGLIHYIICRRRQTFVCSAIRFQNPMMRIFRVKLVTGIDLKSMRLITYVSFYFILLRNYRRNVRWFDPLRMRSDSTAEGRLSNDDDAS